MTARRAPEPGRFVYVWEWPVRLTHWVIAGSFVVLLATGLLIGHPFLAAPGPARSRFVMGTVRAVHGYAALAFALAVLARLAWMLLGNRYARWSEFVPASRERWRGIAPMLAFYLFFRRRPPESVGHNPLAGLAYTAVFALEGCMIATGLALHGLEAHVGSLLRVCAALAPLFGGAQTARWLHHGIMWLLVGFVIHHVYSAVLITLIERNATIESIVSGYKFLRDGPPAPRAARADE